MPNAIERSGALPSARFLLSNTLSLCIRKMYLRTPAQCMVVKTFLAMPQVRPHDLSTTLKLLLRLGDQRPQIPSRYAADVFACD